ncbi:MAG: phosphoenolpyruvate synthase [Xanthomonadaceae bacterium]|nr:phosphoenolpyruvate synthase [Xanthomonadaceae bacterium]
MTDVEQVGGKNASLGEMIGQLADAGVRVPGGFATTALAFRDFLAKDDLAARINARLSDLDTENVTELSRAGAEIRGWVMAASLPERLHREITDAYHALGNGKPVAVAVRSSATAEDLPEASFAGQQETFLNVRGIDAVIRAVHEVFASLFNDRAIAYRVHQDFDHAQVALSAGIQRMVRSDIGASGVMFTLDTESGFDKVVFITSSYGLGETVVQGAVNPDEFYVYKPGLAAGHEAILRRNRGTKAIKMVYGAEGGKAVETIDVPEADRNSFSLSDADIHALARQAVTIEQHYGRAMDIEWGKDGITDMTDPDWEPIMKRAAAVCYDCGGRTCHAAIIARELGIPAVVGCGDATRAIADGAPVTVSCAEGDTGFIYEGEIPFKRNEVSLDALPEIPLKIMMNVGNPDRAFDFAGLPHRGVGLARLEFIINRMIGVHPKALLEFDRCDDELQGKIRAQIAGYADPVSFYVDRLAEGIATIGAAFAPEPVIVRMSDFKSNEYANLIGGAKYEPHEENPMLGFRGASRYIDESFRDCFELECRALRKVRNDMGLTNVQVMIPFVRTVAEAEQVVTLLKDNGLERGKDGLKVIMMCELPSNALLADRFLDHFDGFSIGSNDLTQLTLGLDRDSGVIAHLFDERNDAVKSLLAMAIKACIARGKYIGICGQGPSDHPDFAQWLVEQGIESVSLNPDTVLSTWLYLAEHQA